MILFHHRLFLPAIFSFLFQRIFPKLPLFDPAADPVEIFSNYTIIFDKTWMKIRDKWNWSWTIISSFLQLLSLLHDPFLNRKGHGKIKNKSFDSINSFLRQKSKESVLSLFTPRVYVHICARTGVEKNGEGNVVFMRARGSIIVPRWRRHNKQNSLRWKRFSVWQGAGPSLSLPPCWINLIARGCGRPFEEWPYDRLTLTVITPWIIQVLPLISGRG